MDKICYTFAEKNSIPGTQVTVNAVYEACIQYRYKSQQIRVGSVATTVTPETPYCSTTVLLVMAQSDATADGNDEKVNLRLPEAFLADMDERWQEQGYNSRSEFMREALRDAVYGTRLSKRALEDLLESERQFEEGETVSAEEARERFGGYE